MRDTFLPFSPPSVGEEEIAEVVDTLRSGWLTTGPRTKAFESAFTDFVGAPAALALNSCTAGLHLALAVHDIGSGDEVVTSTLTFTSTANVIEWVGATPVLVDVEPDTLNLDPARVAEAITDRTRAIVVVHYAGHPVDMPRILEIADARGIPVIEDAAHALPAHWVHNGQEHMVGASSRLTSFSFYATKNLTTGEGGMLTGAPDLIARARSLSLHGMSRDAWKRYENTGSWFYGVEAAGFKCNMTDVAAAIGLVQLRRLPGLQLRRARVVEAYEDAFGDGEIGMPLAVRPGICPAYHLYPLRLVDALDRNAFIEGMRRRKVGTSVHFIPVHLHAHYRERWGTAAADFPVAQAQYERLVSLPLHPGLTDRDVSEVIEAAHDTAEDLRG